MTHTTRDDTAWVDKEGGPWCDGSTPSMTRGDTGDSMSKHGALSMSFSDDAEVSCGVLTKSTSTFTVGTGPFVTTWDNTMAEALKDALSELIGQDFATRPLDDSKEIDDSHHVTLDDTTALVTLTTGASNVGYTYDACQGLADALTDMFGL
jgi:hypothetical protein